MVETLQVYCPPPPQVESFCCCSDGASSCQFVMKSTNTIKHKQIPSHTLWVRLHLTLDQLFMSQVCLHLWIQLPVWQKIQINICWHSRTTLLPPLWSRFRPDLTVRCKRSLSIEISRVKLHFLSLLIVFKSSISSEIDFIGLNEWAAAENQHVRLLFNFLYHHSWQLQSAELQPL